MKLNNNCYTQHYQKTLFTKYNKNYIQLLMVNIFCSIFLSLNYRIQTPDPSNMNNFTHIPYLEIFFLIIFI